jgi:aryl-alcohol dehydrogenase-like predicted oxidoreductase
MNPQSRTRRLLLQQSLALGCASALGGRAWSASLSAAAAGTIVIGGDLKVVRLGFGAMRITGEGIWGEPRDTAEARKLLRRALALGVNFIDTADAYGPAVSERLIAEALHPYPRDLVIATKGGLVRPSAREWQPDGRPEHLRSACDASLKRLRLERIDLYQFHRPDPDVPLAESLGALKDLQSAGKIRHIGLSNVDVPQLRLAQGIIKVVSVQNRYNVADRASEDVLKVCEHERIAFLPWGPLAQRPQGPGSAGDALNALNAIAGERRLPMPTVALAWLLARSPVMLPIPGTSRIDHLEEDLQAARLRLGKSELKRIG